jgi:hypothetical protein
MNQGLSVAGRVADIMGDMLGWDSDERKRQLEAYQETVELSRRFAR